MILHRHCSECFACIDSIFIATKTGDLNGQITSEKATLWLMKKFNSHFSIVVLQDVFHILFDSFKQSHEVNRAGILSLFYRGGNWSWGKFSSLPKITRVNSSQNKNLNLCLLTPYPGFVYSHTTSATKVNRWNIQILINWTNLIPYKVLTNIKTQTIGLWHISFYTKLLTLKWKVTSWIDCVKNTVEQNILVARSLNQ